MSILHFLFFIKKPHHRYIKSNWLVNVLCKVDKTKNHLSVMNLKLYYSVSEIDRITLN